MDFAREPFSQSLLEEMMPLWKSHHAEIADEIYGPLDPDIAVYARSYAAGVLRIFTFRYKQVLQGYQVFFVNKHPHSKDSLQAVQDILYLTPSFRRGLNGYGFIRWCCDQLAGEGVEYVHQHISARHDFGPVLERMGFMIEDLVYAKKLEVA